MQYTDIKLITPSGIPCCLSNEFPDVTGVTDAIEDAKDANDLLERLRKIKSYCKTITLDRARSNYLRYKLIANMCNNISYLIIQF